MTGAAGFDGKVAWSQDASGQSQVETADAARELAVNAAYRDRLAFWYPERAPARIAYKERANADGADFDVIRITPEGGRPFELWINTQTKLIERLVEREAQETRTETYMDLRDRRGREDPVSRAGVARRSALRRTRRRRRDGVQSAADRRAVRAARRAEAGLRVPRRPGVVEVPFEIHNGHLFLKVMLNGKGPFRMLFDSGGINVLLPQVLDADRPRRPKAR